MERAFMFIGGGFLLSVLWFDLKFDVLAWKAMTSGGEVSAAALGTIRTYYSQALSTESSGFPLIMFIMGLAVLGALLHAYRGQRLWSRIALPFLVLIPVGWAGVKIVPMANKLAFTENAAAAQSQMAVNILQDHLLCFGFISTFLVAQLVSYFLER